MSVNIMKLTLSVWARGLFTPLVISLLALGGCNTEESDDADGLGGAPAYGKQNGSGGKVEGAGGTKASTGGASSGGGSGPSPTGGSEGPTSGGSSSGGDASGGEAGALLGTGGAPTGEPEPRWIAITVDEAGGDPLVLARSDGKLDAVTVFDAVAPSSAPAWASDGKGLLFLEDSCCGMSNAAYEIAVNGEELGPPVLIHEPLTSGATIRSVGYSPTGEYLLGRFVDSSMSARYALRRRDAGPSEWTFLTPGAPWGPSDLEPAWSPDGGSLLLAQGNTQAGWSIHRIDIGEATFVSSEILSVPPGGERLFEVAWSMNSESFVIGGSHSLHLGHRDHTGLLLISQGPSDALGSSGGGASGSDEEPEYGPHRSLEFSPDSRRLVYSSYDAGAYAGSMRLWGVDLQNSSSPAKTALLGGQSSHDLSLSGVVWTSNDEIYLSADMEVSGRYDVLRIKWTGAVETRVRLPDGHASHGFAWLPGGVIYLTEDTNYVPNHLSFVAHDKAPEAASILFEFEENVVPGWSNFLGAPSPRVGGFFTAYALDLDSGYQDSARLWHFTSEGVLELLAGPLESSGAFSDPAAFDRKEEQFAFTYDIDGDYFFEVGVSQRVNGKFREPIVVAELLDLYGATPNRLVWQP